MNQSARAPARCRLHHQIRIFWWASKDSKRNGLLAKDRYGNSLANLRRVALVRSAEITLCVSVSSLCLGCEIRRARFQHRYTESPQRHGASPKTKGYLMEIIVYREGAEKIESGFTA